MYSLGGYRNARERVLENRRRWTQIMHEIFFLINATVQYRLPLSIYEDDWNQNECLHHCNKIEHTLDYFAWKVSPWYVIQLRTFARTWATLANLFLEHPNGPVPVLGRMAFYAVMENACHDLDQLNSQAMYGIHRPQLTTDGAPRAWTHYDIPPRKGRL